MTEYEAAEIVLELVGFTHELGEAMQARIEFWSAISYGLIVLAYVAPDRLRIGVSTFLLLLYIMFSMNMLQTIGLDIETVEAAHHDALYLSDEHGLNLESVRMKAGFFENEGKKTSRIFTSLYVPGLFIGTIFFFGATSIKQWRLKKSAGDIP